MNGGRANALSRPARKAQSCCAASSRIAAAGSSGTTKAELERAVIGVTQTRSRISLHAKIRCRSSPSSNLASICELPGRSVVNASASPSIRSVVAKRSGDQCAGAVAGAASGRKGKAQAPAPGQALLFVLGVGRAATDPPLGGAVVSPIVFVASQELLREIRVIVRRKVGSGRGRPPSRSPGHTLSVATAQTGQASTV
jgi:hypothetical protein